MPQPTAPPRAPYLLVSSKCIHIFIVAFWTVQSSINLLSKMFLQCKWCCMWTLHYILLILYESTAFWWTAVTCVVICIRIEAFHCLPLTWETNYTQIMHHVFFTQSLQCELSGRNNKRFSLFLSLSLSLSRSSIISLVVVPTGPVKLSRRHINKQRHKQLPSPPKLMSIVPANAKLETNTKVTQYRTFHNVLRDYKYL